MFIHGNYILDFLRKNLQHFLIQQLDQYFHSCVTHVSLSIIILYDDACVYILGIRSVLLYMHIPGCRLAVHRLVLS